MVCNSRRRSSGWRPVKLALLPVAFVVLVALAGSSRVPRFDSVARADEPAPPGGGIGRGEADDRSRSPDPEFLAVATRKALDRYLAEIEEIERVAALRKSEAGDRLLRALEATEKFGAEPGPRYRGMIGTYYYSDGVAPFILLSVPDGTNVYNREVRETLNGRVDLSREPFRFEARGHVVVPRDGTYHLEAGRGYGSFKLNGIGYGLTLITSQRCGADVQLRQGVHDVLMTVGNNGGQLLSARVAIADKETGRSLPIFIYDSELRAAFSEGRATGLEPIEVSRWSPEKSKLGNENDARGPKSGRIRF